MGYKYDADALCLKIAHKVEELLNFLFIQRGCRFVQDKDLTIHVYGTCYCDHLLDRDRAVAELFCSAYGNTELIKELICLTVDLCPVCKRTLCTSDVHILCYREVRAESDLLVNRCDTFILCILGRLDVHGRV